MKKMGVHSSFVLFYFYFFFAKSSLAAAAQNFEVPWSTKTFGPDGPWQAVMITVGGNDSTRTLRVQSPSDLTVYPGGEWNSLAFAPSACDPYPNSLCGAGGFWDPDLTSTRTSISFPASWVDNSTGVHVSNAQRVILGLTINQRTVWNASLASASSGNVTYPNGKVGGVPLGYLSLGADNSRQFFTLSDSRVGMGINASIFPAQLYEDKTTPSNSYGLHIGSAAFNYPGSLVFGGYNKGRVIGPVTSFKDQNAVDLLDISIGVATGDSPFNFTGKDKLLSTGQTSVTPDPLSPYLSLPRETCDRLASVLPVRFDKDLQYYLWNTDDPNFARIVSSPAYLGFTFPPSPGTTNNVVIKVPFALLNLTLEAPITNTPKQYFPCLPYKYTPKLGRAFLQAAFLGRNWGTKTSWLAQAPGPGPARKGLGDQNTDIPNEATMIDGFPGADLFADTWKGKWSLLDNRAGVGGGSQSGGSGVDNGSTSSGLSTGAKAGIGVGAALGAITVLVAAVFFWRRRSTRNKASQPHADTTNGVPVPYDDQHQHRNEKIPTDHYAHQVNGGSHNDGRISELPASTYGAPVEIADNSVQYGSR